MKIKGPLSVDGVTLLGRIKRVNANFDQRILDAYLDLAPQFGIDAAVALAQSNFETDWWRSMRAVTYHNYCGLGSNSDTGVIGFQSTSIIMGVLAHLSHLQGYTDPVYRELCNQCDPKYKYARSAGKGEAFYVDNLGGTGKWADDPLYGYKIWKRYIAMGGI